MRVLAIAAMGLEEEEVLTVVMFLKIVLMVLRTESSTLSLSRLRYCLLE
jgi:hypothetical protein